MKSLLKKLLPLCFIDFYRKVKVMQRYFRLRTTLAKNSSVNTKHDTVVILGNGPSIKLLDLPLLLANQDVIVMNAFYRHPDVSKLNIAAYCFGEQGANVAHCDISRVLKTESRQYWFSADFASKITPLSNNIHIYFPGNDDVLSKHRRHIDLSRPAPYYEATSQMAIIIAISMGYKKIVLLGYDHDYLASGEIIKHFYEEDVNDEPSISKLYIDGSDYHALIQNCERMWARYKKINIYARFRGIQIINCGKNSYLDVFRRHPLETTIMPISKHLENML